jgi:hypothetical protein
VALLLLNSLLVFVLLNLVCWGLWAFHDRTPRSQKLDAYGIEMLQQVYPGWAPEALAALLLEDDTVSEYEPYTQFRPKTKTGRFVNVAPEGFRRVEGQRPWPPGVDILSVFVFGGSTTFGAGVADARTIPSRLQAHLDAHRCGDAAVYNFGRPQYFSSQERVLFKQLIVAGFVPKVAIFVDGLNDFYHASGLPNWTEAIAGMVEHANDRRGIRWAAADLVRRLPLTRAAAAVGRRLRRLGGRVPRTDAPGHPPADPGMLRQVIARWVVNKRLDEAVARDNGIRTVFVWQPVPTYRYDLSQHTLSRGDLGYFGEHGRSREGYALMATLRPTLGLGPEVLWLDGIQEGRRENLYVDSVHYTEAFSDEIAGRIADHLRQQSIVRCAS